MDFKHVIELVDQQENEFIKRMRGLIGIDNQNPPGENYAQVVEMMERVFQGYGLETTRVVVPDEKIKQLPFPLSGERINLVSRMNNSKPSLSVYAHMDTVPIGEGWNYDPFGGEVDGGRIFGRGTADVKGAIASVWTALDVMQQLNLEPQWDVNVLLCTDEEVGIYPGLYHLALEGYVAAPVISMEFAQDPILRLGSNGSMDIIIDVVGKSSHSGWNYAGINSIEESVPILVELLKLKEEVQARRSEVPLHPEAPGGPNRLAPMFTLAMMDAGVKSNVVPDKARITINRRFIPEESAEDVKNEIQEAIDRGAALSQALEVNVQYHQIYPSFRQSADHLNARRLVEAMKIVHGYTDDDFVRTGSGGSTDMSFVAQVLQTDEIVTFGLGRAHESNLHAPDENVRLSDALAHVKELIYLFCTPISE